MRAYTEQRERRTTTSNAITKNTFGRSGELEKQTRGTITATTFDQVRFPLSPISRAEDHQMTLFRSVQFACSRDVRRHERNNHEQLRLRDPRLSTINTIIIIFFVGAHTCLSIPSEIFHFCQSVEWRFCTFLQPELTRLCFDPASIAA